MSSSQSQATLAESVHAHQQFLKILDSHTYHQRGRPVIVTKKGFDLCQDNFLNKGLAFNEYERDRLDLRGLIPPATSSLKQQYKKAMIRWGNRVANGASPIELWQELQTIRHRNYSLYQKIVGENIIEMSRIVYTPTIGEVCQTWHLLWQRPREMYFTLHDRGHFDTMIYNWPYDEVDLIVVTDGSRVLGLGDLGINGAAICLGKIELYVAGGGINPTRTLPCCLDSGTNNKELLQNDHYFGICENRIEGTEFYDMVDEFMLAMTSRYPSALIHFEDFATEKARVMLSRYRSSYFVFNDDIQGTGCVGLAAVLALLRAQKRPIEDLLDMNIVICGAGSSAIGIVEMLHAQMTDLGITSATAAKRFFVLDSKGLIAGPEPYEDAMKETFRQEDYEKNMSLLDVCKNVHPDVLIGCSGQPKVFTDAVLKEVAKHRESPLIMPLSNPTSKSECTAEEAFTACEGRCYFASGSPFDHFEYEGRVHHSNQCNNVYIFPGLGLGAIVSGAWRITDRMLYEAANALVSFLTEEDLAEKILFPRVESIHKISAHVAAAVGKTAWQQEVAHGRKLNIDWSLPVEQLRVILQQYMWHPEYEKYVYRESRR